MSVDSSAPLEDRPTCPRDERVRELRRLEPIFRMASGDSRISEFENIDHHEVRRILRELLDDLDRVKHLSVQGVNPRVAYLMWNQYGRVSDVLKPFIDRVEAAEQKEREKEDKRRKVVEDRRCAAEFTKPVVAALRQLAPLATALNDQSADLALLLLIERARLVTTDGLADWRGEVSDYLVYLREQAGQQKLNYLVTRVEQVEHSLDA